MPEPTGPPPPAVAAFWRRLLPGAARARPLLPDEAGVARSGVGHLPPGARLLLLRPDHLGDLLLLGPALACLAAERPDLRLTLLVGPWSEAVARRLPGGAAVETFGFPWFDRGPRRPRLQVLAALWRQARRLRGRFDAALVLRDDDQVSAWLAAGAGLPLRLGHGHPRLAPFLSHALPPAPPTRHSAALNLDLAAAALGLAAPPGDWSPADHPLGFHRLPAEEAAAAALLVGAMDMAGSAEGPRHGIAIHPGSGAPVKRWQASHWAALARRLLERGEPLLLTGGAAEAALTAELAALLPEQRVLDLAGRTDLGVLAALFARCRLVLGPDSGPLHLAVAVGTPTVHLFGPADARRFGPWGPPERHRVVASTLDCAPCGRLDWEDLAAHPCVRELEPARVLGAARGVLGLGDASPSR